MTIKTVEVYEARDGKTFETREACEQYESELKKAESIAQLRQSVDAIEHILSSCAPFGYGYVDTERYEYCWFKPKNVEEVINLFNFFDVHIDEPFSRYTNEWYGFEIDGDYDYYTGSEDVYFLGSPEDSLQQLKEFYASFGYKISIE